MRSLSTTMKKKLASRIQAGDNALSASLWVARPTTPLTEDRYLEKQTVLSSGNITKTSIAVCHPRLMRGATEVYIGYLEAGTIKIAKTTYVEEMSRHVWENDVGYSQVADDFCLCFDGTMPKAPNGYVEFKTEQLPWVFWTLDGVLYGRRLDDNGEPFILAETNCSAVSAIRAMWSTTGGFDFGLVVFFILSGQLYYRQLINGEWMDAEVVSFGPSGMKWEALAAFRTWDYRIGVQLKSTGGTFYEMFTQFMGVGKQNTEHLELSNVKAASALLGIQYSSFNSTEHICATAVEAGAPYRGLYSTASPVIVAAFNRDDGTGDWGKEVVVEFNVHMRATTFVDNGNAFTLLDERGGIYMATDARLDETTAKSAVLSFPNINAAFGDCKLIYTPGSVRSMADTEMGSVEFTFTPTELVPPDVDPPVPTEVWNDDENGTVVKIRFTEAIVSDPAGNEEKFTIGASMYDMVPAGTLYDTIRSVSQVKPHATVESSIDLTSGTFDGTAIDGEVLTLKEVDTDG